MTNDLPAKKALKKKNLGPQKVRGQGKNKMETYHGRTEGCWADMGHSSKEIPTQGTCEPYVTPLARRG